MTIGFDGVSPADAIDRRYREDCQVASVTQGPKCGGVQPYALDPQRAGKLWMLSKSLV